MDAGTMPRLRPAREDFGGCRCQALLLAGDATATDPACSLAPAHHIIEAATGRSQFQRGGFAARSRVILCAVAAASWRSLELPHQSAITDPESPRRSLPANADRDRSHVGCDVAVFPWVMRASA